MAGIFEDRIRPYLNDITIWRSKGHSLNAMAESLGVKKSTFKDYVKRYPELENAVLEGEEEMLCKLEEAALRSACGYKFEEKKTEIIYDKDGSEVGRKVAVFEKIQPPNSAVLVRALEAMNAKKWIADKNDNNEIEVKISPELLEFSE